DAAHLGNRTSEVEQIAIEGFCRLLGHVHVSLRRGHWWCDPKPMVSICSGMSPRSFNALAD
ncbi:MAG TPA: hypothetical protein VLJ17_05060, partial [Xanthobacteraceae bacterium]|nr:hypothetical protein [Xanthobacteraceae bacterium]